MRRKVEDASGAEAESKSERRGIRGFPLQYLQGYPYPYPRKPIPTPMGTGLLWVGVGVLMGCTGTKPRGGKTHGFLMLQWRCEGAGGRFLSTDVEIEGHKGAGGRFPPTSIEIEGQEGVGGRSPPLVSKLRGVGAGGGPHPASVEIEGCEGVEIKGGPSLSHRSSVEFAK